MKIKFYYIIIIILCAFTIRYIAINVTLSNNIVTFQNQVYTRDSLLTSIDNYSNRITIEYALDSVYKLIGTLPKGYHLDYDHSETIVDKEYYVIHYYEVVIDNYETGEGHTATYDWYYVDKSNGEIYKLDIVNDILIKIIKGDNTPN